MVGQFIIKMIITSAIVVSVSEIAKKSTFVGSLIISWPITSLLVFFWIYYENKDIEKIAQMSFEILYLIIPSLVLFIIFPILLKKGLGFYTSIILSLIITSISYWFFIRLINVLKQKFT